MAKPRTFIACFTFDRRPEADDPEQGSFQVVVDAASPEDAMRACRRRVVSMRRELFEPGDRLYFMGLLKLPAKRPEALLLNYDIGDAPKVATGIGSLCPEQPGAERVEEYGDEATDAEREMKAFYVVPAPTKKRRPAAAR